MSTKNKYLAKWLPYIIKATQGTPKTYINKKILFILIILYFQISKVNNQKQIMDGIVWKKSRNINNESKKHINQNNHICFIAVYHKKSTSKNEVLIKITDENDI